MLFKKIYEALEEVHPYHNLENFTCDGLRMLGKYYCNYSKNMALLKNVISEGTINLIIEITTKFRENEFS